MPRLPWIMFQSWRDLLFAHWRMPADLLRPLIPGKLTLEEFDGSAWVGMAPFDLPDLRARWPANFPVAGFPELNLRTYVRVGGRPGIYFFSLDAGHRAAVRAARTFYRLPYHLADMGIEHREDWIHYTSRRKEGEAEFVGRYRPTGSADQASPGTLEHFLVERYALYVVLGNGRVLRADIHHRPWQIQPAEAEFEVNTIARAAGISLPNDPPLLHFAARQDTLIWAPTLVS